jgi:hypothetical protein
VRWRSKDHLYWVLAWAPVLVAAGVLVSSCFLPTFEIAIEASIGAGAEQQSFRYAEVLSIAGDLLLFGLIPLGAGVILVGLALLGLARGTIPWACVASLLLALLLAAIVFDTEDKRLGWTGSHGVVGYEQPNGGPLLQRAIDVCTRTPYRRPRLEIRAGRSAATKHTRLAGCTAGGSSSGQVSRCAGSRVIGSSGSG